MSSPLLLELPAAEILAQPGDSYSAPLLRHFPNLTDYRLAWTTMQHFTQQRTATAPDELWTLQHFPVYTLGQAGKPEHLLRPTSIPLLQTDRGGQITYHGPGQIVLYTLLDLRRRRLGVKQLVQLLENAVLTLLEELGLTGQRRAGAPGVYVEGAKIAALGLRIQRGYSTHGLSFNVNPDLDPFSAINPCGYTNLHVTSTQSLGLNEPLETLRGRLVALLLDQLALFPPNVPRATPQQSLEDS